MLWKARNTGNLEFPLRKFQELFVNCSWTGSWTCSQCSWTTNGQKYHEFVHEPIHELYFFKSSWTHFMKENGRKYHELFMNLFMNSVFKKFMNSVHEQQMAENIMNLFMNFVEEVHELSLWTTNGQKYHELVHELWWRSSWTLSVNDKWQKVTWTEFKKFMYNCMENNSSPAKLSRTVNSLI